MADAFTLPMAHRFCEIARAAQRNLQVARISGDEDLVHRGQARRIADAAGNFNHGADVRSLFLIVSLDSGWEAAWPVSELIDEVGETFLLNPHLHGAPLQRLQD